MIKLLPGMFGWDYLIVNVETGADLLVQSDFDYPGVASAFGWTGDDDDIVGAQEYLDEHLFDTAEDPGYFD